jgi:hypothetical protein
MLKRKVKHSAEAIMQLLTKQGDSGQGSLDGGLHPRVQGGWPVSGQE